jgi:hypothetical protein
MRPNDDLALFPILGDAVLPVGPEKAVTLVPFFVAIREETGWLLSRSIRDVMATR